MLEEQYGGNPISWKQPGGKKARTLLKILLTQPNTYLSIDQLIEYLWGDNLPQNPESGLRTNIWHLRNILEPDSNSKDSFQIIKTKEGLGYGIFTGEQCWIDAVEFQKLIASADELKSLSSNSEAMELYEQAIELFRGDFLQEDLYEDWAFNRREDFRQEYYRALSFLAKEYSHDENLTKSISCAERALKISPGDEALHRLLMSAHCETGNRNRAIEQFHRLQEYLDELGAQPERETLELYQEILAGKLSSQRTSAESSKDAQLISSDTEQLDSGEGYKQNGKSIPRMAWGVGAVSGAVFTFIILALLVGPMPSAMNSELPQSTIRNVSSSEHIPTGSPIVPPEGIVAWWDGDRFTDDLTKAKDLIGDHDGRFIGDVFQVDGVVGRAFSFEGGFSSHGQPGAYIIVPPSEELDIIGPVTIELWAKLEELNSGNDNMLIAKGSFPIEPNDEPVSYALDIDGVAFEIGGYFERDDNSNNFVGAPMPDDGEFHHYAYVRDSELNRIYIDGELMGESFVFAPAGSSEDVGLAIGGAIHTTRRISETGYCCEFKGIIDEVSIYNRALTDEEILLIFEAGTAGKMKPED